MEENIKELKTGNTRAPYRKRVKVVDHEKYIADYNTATDEYKRNIEKMEKIVDKLYDMTSKSNFEVQPQEESVSVMEKVNGMRHMLTLMIAVYIFLYLTWKTIGIISLWLSY